MLALLCVMDGYGLREPLSDNAIAAANTPNLDRLFQTCPHSQIECSGEAVGLPDGQMGNSEVGHLNLGAGRVVYQEVTRIDKSIRDGDFFDNEVLCRAMEEAAATGKAVHLFGLLSDGLVHSSMEHLYALVELAKQKNVTDVFLHAFMDGRDTSPTSGVEYMQQAVTRFSQIGLGQVSTISGRYWAMDRDKRWRRVEKGYQAIVNGQGKSAQDPVEAIRASYAEEVTDEFMEPTVMDLGSPETGRLSEGDTAIIFNFRADRVRELSYLFLGYDIEAVNHPENPNVRLITMTEYDAEMSGAEVAYPPRKLENLLGEEVARNGLKQLRTAETEKYAHVTFFFNGGVEQPFEGEDRDLIPSPRVATYDLKPEMSSVEVTDNVVEKINSGKYSLVILNYANCDMVGHTGIFEAARKAVEAVDRGLGRVLEAVSRQNGVALISADHGNAEKMIDPGDGGPWTAHTTNPVPLVLFDPSAKLGPNVGLCEGGILADVAPTLLEILNLEQPSEMTGKSLLIRG